jgi:hypothetical protein
MIVSLCLALFLGLSVQRTPSGWCEGICSFSSLTLSCQDWSIPEPTPPIVSLAAARSADVDDDLEKLRHASGLHRPRDLNENTTGGGINDLIENDWP